jgi:CHAT domain-containing protein
LQARRGLAADAWRSLEASLARGLLDEVTAFRDRPLDAADAKRAKEARERVTLLRGQLAALRTLANPSADEKAKLAQLGKDLDEAQLNRSNIENDLVRKYGPAVGRPYSLDEIQSRIPADAALVAWVDSFAQHSGASEGSEHWACVLRRRGAPKWVALPGAGRSGAWTATDSALASRLRALMAVRPKEGDELWRETAKQLSRQRMAPLRDSLQAANDQPAVRHLVVLPSPALAGIPIEAIQESASADAVTISYAPSATLFAWLGERRQESDKPSRLLALGDPVFIETSKPPDAARPWTDELLRSARGSTLERLPGTRREVEAISPLFPKSEKLLGAEASEMKLENLASADRLKEFDILHIATHGIIDDRIPMNSALMLSQSDLPDALTQALAGKKVYEGKLTARQIRQDWKLNAQLVTLSACQTGLGKYSAGEGFLGFSQSLFFAGSQNVVLSLWKVDDTATALLMKRFYENLLGARPDLKGPQSKARALQLAKEWLRDLKADEAEKLIDGLPKIDRGQPKAPTAKFEAARRFDHPYYWAGFVLIGGPK